MNVLDQLGANKCLKEIALDCLRHVLLAIFARKPHHFGNSIIYNLYVEKQSNAYEEKNKSHIVPPPHGWATPTPLSFTSSSRWPPREALGTHKTSDPPRFSGKPKLFDRERFKSSVLPPSAVIKDHAEPHRALNFQATARRGEEPLDGHERHDDTLGVRLGELQDALYKGRELAGRPGRTRWTTTTSWTHVGTQTRQKGDGRTGRGGGEVGAQDCRNTMERRVLVRHLERPHAQVDRVGAICTTKKLTTAGDTRVRSRRRRPRVPFARDEQREAAGRRAATQGS
ncbi:hypothetical protein PsorP6_008058 [Peronosclerospora sorghi]|uniref:Uncharacterized protein n=1 Tax=Peronosclerospora sorghi TaxID=230839 RepID=A0ACC0W7G6_9STRA|nr:hypothetical protein PsorP6_008058 [Peronosclerospora sorghi]